MWKFFTYAKIVTCWCLVFICNVRVMYTVKNGGHTNIVRNCKSCVSSWHFLCPKLGRNSLMTLWMMYQQDRQMICTTYWSFSDPIKHKLWSWSSIALAAETIYHWTRAKSRLVVLTVLVKKKLPARQHQFSNCSQAQQTFLLLPN